MKKPLDVTVGREEVDKSNKEFEELEQLKVTFQIELYKRAIKDLASKECALAVELLKGMGY